MREVTFKRFQSRHLEMKKIDAVIIISRDNVFILLPQVGSVEKLSEPSITVTPDSHA